MVANPASIVSRRCDAAVTATTNGWIFMAEWIICLGLHGESAIDWGENKKNGAESVHVSVGDGHAVTVSWNERRDKKRLSSKLTHTPNFLISSNSTEKLSSMHYISSMERRNASSTMDSSSTW